MVTRPHQSSSRLSFPDLNTETCLQNLPEETAVSAHLACLCLEHFLIRMSLKLVAVQAGSPVELTVHALWNSLSITEINFPHASKQRPLWSLWKQFFIWFLCKPTHDCLLSNGKIAFIVCYQRFLILLSHPLSLVGGFWEPQCFGVLHENPQIMKCVTQ